MFFVNLTKVKKRDPVKLFICLFFVSMSSYAQNINWFASADFVGEANEEDSYNQGLGIREFELAMHTQVDQDWATTMSFVYAQDPNSQTEVTELHEVFIQSSTVFSGHRLKLGQFFLNTGKMNKTHRHEWNMTSAPLFFYKYFGEEGVLDKGIEYTHFIGADANLTLVLGLTKGNQFAHLHVEDEHEHEEEGEEKQNAMEPTRYIRLGSFIEHTTTIGTEIGLNYIGRRDAEKTAWHYAGIDITHKQREAKTLSFLFQAEAWSRTYKYEGFEEYSDSGYYVYLEKGINQHHSLGLGVNAFFAEKDLDESLHEHSGRTVHDKYDSYFVNYTYANSEFLRYRFTVEKEAGLEVDEEEVNNMRYTLQMVFNIGKHPIHMF